VAKQGQKGRKIGRQKNRSKAQARYHGEKRWIENKKKKMARHARKMAKIGRKILKRLVLDKPVKV
jgi:hypothetical protein